MNQSFDLKKVSDLTLRKLRRMDLVTPPVFEKTFLEIAFEMGYPEDLLASVRTSQELMEQSLLQLEKVQQGTKQGMDQLQSSANMAEKAIVEQDQESLRIAQKDVAQLQAKLKQLETTIYEDALTRVHNRKWLMDVLLDNGRFRTHGTMAILDLDRFKHINDTYGHVTGDKVLVLVATLMKLLYRSGETLHLVRYGGDEFLAFHLEPTDPGFLDKELKELRTKLGQKEVQAKGQSFTVGFSYGLMPFTVNDAFDTILETADKLMYKDKARYAGLNKEL